MCYHAYMRMVILISALIAFRPVGNAAFAQDLKMAKIISCEVGQGFAATWRGTWKPERSSWRKRNTMIFTNIDRHKGRAKLIGNIATVDVYYLVGAESINFIEITPLGSVNLMTVYLAPSNGSYPFVISRHVDVIGVPLPSQYYGLCKIVR